MHEFRTLTSLRYEAKRQEIEAWLMRMESRSERMGSHEAQADVLDFSVLDSQQKEQKVCFLNLWRRIRHPFYACWTFDFFLPFGQFRIHVHLVADAS